MKETEAFYKTTKWQQTRDYVYKRAGGLCENCLKQGIVTPGEIVHHIKHITPTTMYDNKVAYSPENLILLCRECHGLEHKTKTKRVNIDTTGRVSPRFDKNTAIH